LLYWRALAVHEQAGPKLAAMFDHVLVDEYQDVTTPNGRACASPGISVASRREDVRQTPVHFPRVVRPP